MNVPPLSPSSGLFAQRSSTTLSSPGVSYTETATVSGGEPSADAPANPPLPPDGFDLSSLSTSQFAGMADDGVLDDAFALDDGSDSLSSEEIDSLRDPFGPADGPQDDGDLPDAGAFLQQVAQRYADLAGTDGGSQATATLTISVSA